MWSVLMDAEMHKPSLNPVNTFKEIRFKHENKGTWKIAGQKFSTAMLIITPLVL